MKQSKTSGDFCLSDKILFDRMLGIVLKEEDVKEFVSKVKIMIREYLIEMKKNGYSKSFDVRLNELAGDKLI